MPAVTAHGQRTVAVVSGDNLRPFLNDYLGGRIREPADPRASGMVGAYPGIWDRAPHYLPRLLYQRVGKFRTIVDMPADDIWSKGWELVLDEPKLAEEVRKLDASLRIKTAHRLATRMARRDGVALIRYRLLDNTGDPSLPAAGVREVLEVEALPIDVISKIDLDEDPTSRHYGRPLIYHLRASAGSGAYDRVATQSPSSTAPSTTVVRVHRDRVELVIQHPKEGSKWEGDPVLGWLIGDAQGSENVKWAAAEGYLSRNVPPYVVTLDPELNLDPENNPDDKAKLDELDEQVGKLESGLIQKIRLGGATITPLLGADRINPPDSYARMFTEDLAAGARIPQRELTGDASGALAAAGWDAKRYFSRISADQEDFATPLLLTWYERLDKWGLFPGLMKRMRGVHWFPHIEMSETERATVLDTTARAVTQFRAARVPIPMEVGKLVTWPDDFDPAVVPEPAANPFLLAGALNASSRKPRRDSPILPAKLARIEQRYEEAILTAIAEWEQEALRELSASDPGILDRLRGKTDKPSALLGITFQDAKLRAVLEKLLLEAADLGMMRTWQQLGETGDVKRFIETGRAPTLIQFARTTSARKAAAASSKVRGVIAESIARGDGLQEMRESLRESFGRLENETAIARTEAMTGYNHGGIASMQEAGLTEWEFSVYDGACVICAPLDGTVYPLTDTSMLPPRGTHPMCRCSALPVIQEDDA